MMVGAGAGKELWCDSQECKISLRMDGNVLWAGEEAQWVKRLVHKHEDLSGNLQHPHENLGIILHFCDNSTGEANAGESLNSLASPPRPIYEFQAIERLCLKK